MDVALFGAPSNSLPLLDLNNQASRGLTSGNTLPERRSSIHANPQNSPVSISDRLEISGALPGSENQSARPELLVQLRADGTYSLGQLGHPANRLSALNGFSANGDGTLRVDLDAISDQLRGVIADLRRGIPDSLSQLARSLRASETDTGADPVGVDFRNLSSADKRLIADYLLLIRQLAGQNTHASRLADHLENFLGIGKESPGNSFRFLLGFDISIVQIEVTYTRLEITSGSSQQQVQEGDPLVLDLDGNGIQLRSLENGVYFDINGDGILNRTGFIAGGDAFLALDKNSNGRIDNIQELFGDATGAKNGFDDLARYDSNGDGRIDHHDPVFTRLLLWQDLNGDGQSSPEELSILADHGITSLELNPIKNSSVVAGNRITETAQFTRSDGTKGSIAEVYFIYLTA